MAGELVLETKISDSYILCDDKEHVVKACLSVYASDEVKERLEGEKQINNGVDRCLLIDVSGSMSKIVGGETTPTGKKQIIDGVKYNIVYSGPVFLCLQRQKTKKIPRPRCPRRRARHIVERGKRALVRILNMQ